LSCGFINKLIVRP